MYLEVLSLDTSKIKNFKQIIKVMCIEDSIDGFGIWGKDLIHLLDTEESKTFEAYKDMILNPSKYSEDKSLESTQLLFFVDDSLCGFVSIRHELNDYLRFKGGNIRYSIVPSMRGKGIGSQMIDQLKIYLIQNFDKVFCENLVLTCDSENIPSAKLIEKFNVRSKELVKDKEGDFIRYKVSAY